MENINRRFIPEGIKEEAWNNMGLLEKYKLTYERDHVYILKQRWPSRAAVATFWYTTVTQLYCFIRYIIPEYFQEYDPTTRYYLKVLMTILIVEGSANWLCVRLYSSENKKTRDNPNSNTLIEITKAKSSKNEDHKIDDKESTTSKVSSSNNVERSEKTYEDHLSDRTGLVWTHCSKCNIPQPPRTHHCKICEVCVLKRDHHCFFTDNCIGYYNQRYFVVLCFYVALACLIGLIFNILYLNWKLGRESSWWDFCLPYSTYKCFWLGEFPIYYVYMVSHLWIMPLVGMMSAGLFTCQTLAINSGFTTHELSDPRCNIKCTGSVDDNRRSVFGTFWWINFLFPAVLIYRQNGNGKHWTDLKKK